MEQSPDLIYAVSEGDIDKCRALIAAGAHVNDGGRHGSPLHLAVIDGKREICSLLIAAGAQLAIRDANEWTPLMHAARHERTALCRLLIDAGASPFVRGRGLESAVSLCDQPGTRNPDEIVLTLLSAEVPVVGAERDEALEVLSEALRDFAMRGNPSVCQLLIDAGADANQENDRGWTPLLLAAANNRVETCQVLIAAGATPSLAGRCQRSAPLTPFQIAVASGATNVVAYFIEHHGADCAQRTPQGRTMAQLAGKHCQMQQLLKAAKTAQSVSDCIGNTVAPASSARYSASGPAL